MATFLLQNSRPPQPAPTPAPTSTPTTPAGDHRYRIPTIGLNPGHLPGTRPDLAIRTLRYNPTERQNTPPHQLAP